MGQGLGRRHFLKAAGAAIAAAPKSSAADRPMAEPPAATAPSAPLPPCPTQRRVARLFLDETEAAILTAAVDVFLPADDIGPGGVEAGVVTYIDRQLAGAWGSGARMYLAGPWAEGTPQQGYQMPLTPARLLRVAIAEMDGVAVASYGMGFTELAASQRNDLLMGLDSGDVGLDTVPGEIFLTMLHALVVEGYFADPAHGGNRNMTAWRMIGFPGARGAYVDDIEAYRGRAFPSDPVSLADMQ